MTAHADAAPVEARLRDIQSLTAAVLLADFSSGQLIATAAAGLEEEVRRGVRGVTGYGSRPGHAVRAPPGW